MRKKGHGGQLPKGIYQNDTSLSTAEIVAKETTDAAAGMLIVIVCGRWHTVICGIGFD